MDILKSCTGIISIGISTILLWGCGGGGGGSATPTNAKLIGTAATGAALMGASVAIANSSGNSPCLETSIITSATGGYTCTLRNGEKAPFFITVSDPIGEALLLVSVASETPAAGATLIVNATPLTTAIVAQLNNGDALGVINSKDLYSAAAFAAIKANVKDQLKPLSDDIGATDFDPFTSAITAANADQSGNTADRVLDVLKFVVDDNGKPALSTISDASPVTLASNERSNALRAIQPGAADLSMAAHVTAKLFKACFSLPTSRRVIAADSTIAPALGGPQVTSLAPECRDIATNGTNANGAPAFKHNGYTSGQFFYEVLTSDAMTGAVFSAPEIMAFYAADASNPLDRAALNIRYVDTAGNPGNIITFATKFSGSSTERHPSNWWLTGNGQDVDISIKTLIRRHENFGPNTSNSVWSNLYRSGMSIFTNSNGPNSGLYDSALLTGPGLPDSGLWWFRKNGANSFVLADQRTLNPLPYGSLTDSCSFCYNFWMARTKGLTGVDAATRFDNPIKINFAQGSGIPRIGYNNSNSGLIPTNNYPPENSYNGPTGTRPVKGSLYTFSLYLTTNGVPALYKTITKSLLVDLVDPIYGTNLKWNTPGAKTMAALDPSSPTTTTIPVDWVQNSAAEQINSVTISLIDLNDANIAPVTWGATSVVALAPNGNFFTGISGPVELRKGFTANGYREIYLAHRMLDGTSKQSVFSYSK